MRDSILLICCWCFYPP